MRQLSPVTLYVHFRRLTSASGFFFKRKNDGLSGILIVSMFWLLVFGFFFP